jgi:AraC-like DNA-binding protein
MNPDKASAEPFRFSTDDAPLQDRATLLREVVGRIYTRLDLGPLGEAPVRMAIERHPWASASLLFCEVNPLSSVRTPELIRDADGDFRFIVRVDGTQYQFVAEGVDEVMNGRDGALLFNGAATTINLPKPCAITAIRMRRDVLAAAARGLEDRPIRRVESMSAPLQLLDSYIGVLRKQGPTTDPVLAHQVGTHLVDLVALALGPTEETRVRAITGATRAARLATIRADVLTNLAEVNLTAIAISRRHGVSDRYVHLLFEETGQTFSRFVEEERLKRAFALLRDPARGVKRISEIAAEVGFAELSTFDRAFRRRFGDTPTGVRRGRSGDQND